MGASTPEPAASHCPLIVVAESEELVGLFLCDALGGDHDVIRVADAASGLAALAERAPDLLLLDDLLPGGKSLELWATASALGVPVIWMTGHPEAALRLPSQNLLNKPFGTSALLRKVTAALAAGPARPRHLPTKA